MNRIVNFISGKQKDSFSKSSLPVFDPSTGEVQAEVVLSNKEDFI